MLTPSYAAHLVELAEERGVDLAGSSVERVLVAGEPGGGEEAFRARLEAGWGAKVTEAMGVGDIGVSLFGECEEQDGMHIGARGFVHVELIDPESRRRRSSPRTARAASSCSRHLRHRAAPLPALPHARPCRAADEPVPLRPHRARACAASGGPTTC